MSRLLTACVVLVAALPASVAGQTNRPRVAVGAQVGMVVPSGSDASSQFQIGPMIRFGESGEGWGPAFGLGWYTTVLDGSIGAATGEYAEAHVRPVMAGVAYTWPAGPWSYEAALMVGYTFNSVDLRDAGRGVFAGTSNVDVEISNAIAVRPRLCAWRDLNDRVSWMVGTAITFTKPELTFRSGSTTLTKELGGVSWHIESGIAVRIF